MQPKIFFKTLGLIWFAVLGVEKISGVAFVFAVSAIIIMILAMIIVWIRIDQLSDNTSELTDKVKSLNSRVEVLAGTIDTSETSKE